MGKKLCVICVPRYGVEARRKQIERSQVHEQENKASAEEKGDPRAEGSADADAGWNEPVCSESPKEDTRWRTPILHETFAKKAG